MSVPPWLWTLANLVPFLQVRGDRRKFMSRGACECLSVPGAVTGCLGCGHPLGHLGMLCLTPLLTPPPGWAPAGPEQSEKERGHPGLLRPCPSPVRASGGGAATIPLAQEHLQRSSL